MSEQDRWLCIPRAIRDRCPVPSSIGIKSAEGLGQSAKILQVEAEMMNISHTMSLTINPIPYKSAAYYDDIQFNREALIHLLEDFNGDMIRLSILNDVLMLGAVDLNDNVDKIDRFTLFITGVSEK